MLAIVCHDAGGAEIVSSWLLRYQEPYCLVLEGPAIKVFERKFDVIKLVDLEQAIKISDCVLCGTSWQSNLERLAMRQAKKAGKKSIAYLDHWVNYEERFVENDQILIADEIWVGDENALELAKKLFPTACISFVSNFYFEDLKKELLVASSNFETDSIQILYVGEPIAEHSTLAYGNKDYLGYTQMDSILFLLKNLNEIDGSIKSILIRPHPSESKDKYEWVKEVTNVPIVVGGDRTLLAEVMESDIVVGCESMAMVVGLLANKRVISVIPPQGRQCSLPHKDIQHLREMIEPKHD